MFNTQEIFPVSSKLIHKIIVALLALVAVTLPFKDRFLVNLFIVFVILVWLFSNPFKELFSKKNNLKSLLAILIFYLLHVVSLLYTKNMEDGFMSLEIKISLFFFPLIFYTSFFSPKQIHFFLKNFVAGNVLCCIICLVHSSYISMTEHKIYFFYQDLSWFQHPSYLSMYLTFCCVFLFQRELFNKTTRFVITLFFTFFILLLSSKSGIVIHFGFLSIYFLSGFFAQKNFKRFFLFSVLGAFIFVLIILFVPQIKERFKNVISAVNSEKIDKGATESTAVRMLIWAEAEKIVKQNPLLGVSPGDANYTLLENYQQDGLTGAYEKKLNAHSQYFQTSVELGLVGLTSLLSIFVVSLFGNKNKLLIFFLLITVVNFLTESMLQTMAGSIFFGYFYGLLCFEKKETLNS